MMKLRILNQASSILVDSSRAVFSATMSPIQKLSPPSGSEEGEFPSFFLNAGTRQIMHCLVRICPGSHIALPLIYLIAASILHLFDISPEMDAEGNLPNLAFKFASSSTTS
jgi:hypothetical protein